MKICTKCKKEKEFNEFTNLKRSKDGLYPQCRTCKLEYWQKNRDHEIARNRQWKIDNAEKVAKARKKWNRDNPDKVKKYKATDYQKNKERYDKKNKEWRKNNPEKAKENYRKSYQKEGAREVRRKAQKRRKVHLTDKGRARKLVNYVVTIGTLIKPKTCSHCNEEGKIEGHHADYSKPLEVTWLCRKCHVKEHKRLKQIEETNGKNARENHDGQGA